MADENLVVSKKEAELVKRVAEMYAISEQEAVELVVKKSIAHRVRLRTGKGPAKVYGLKRRTQTSG